MLWRLWSHWETQETHTKSKSEYLVYLSFFFFAVMANLEPDEAAGDGFADQRVVGDEDLALGVLLRVDRVEVDRLFVPEEQKVGHAVRVTVLHKGRHKKKKINEKEGGRGTRWCLLLKGWETRWTPDEKKG
jgi:hypothetical protein